MVIGNAWFSLTESLLLLAWHLLWDFRTIQDLAGMLPQNSPLGNKALVTANKMLNVFKYDDLSTITEARQIAEEVLGKGWAEKQEKIYDEGGRAPSVAISNCHM
jgi:alpha-mannosidase